jgi:hypothetical protein
MEGCFHILTASFFYPNDHHKKSVAPSEPLQPSFNETVLESTSKCSHFVYVPLLMRFSGLLSDLIQNLETGSESLQGTMITV